MSRVGIEAMNVFGGSAVLDVKALAQHRGSTSRAWRTSS